MLLDQRSLRALLLIFVTTTLAACSGGGDDDEEEEDDGPAAPGPAAPESADAAGLWLGTVSRIGAQDPFAVIASPSGEFIAVVISATGNGRLLVGTGTVTGNTLNASGTIFPGTSGSMPNGQPVANVTIPSTTVTERVSMSGSYSGGGEVGIFTLNYDGAKTARGATLAALSATYTTYPAPAGATPNWTVTIQSSGATTYATSTGCNGTGMFTVPDAAYNVYAWTLDVAPCSGAPALSFKGVATLDDNPTGGTNNLLRMFGATALTRDRPFAFVGAE